MSVLFTTDRLTVRRFLPADAADLAEILTDPEVTFFEPYEAFTAEACVREAENFSRSEEFFAVVLGEKVIGKLYFSAREYGTYELGYTFHAGYQGHNANNLSVMLAFTTHMKSIKISKKMMHKNK